MGKKLNNEPEKGDTTENQIYCGGKKRQMKIIVSQLMKIQEPCCRVQGKEDWCTIHSSCEFYSSVHLSEWT